jgi:hypothetical protein
MKEKLMDLVIYGGCLICGLLIGHAITSKTDSVDKGISKNAKNIEAMAVDIELKMGLILEEVKKLKKN